MLILNIRVAYRRATTHANVAPVTYAALYYSANASEYVYVGDWGNPKQFFDGRKEVDNADSN